MTHRLVLLLMLLAVPAYAQNPVEVVELHPSLNQQGIRSYAISYRTAEPQANLRIRPVAYNMHTWQPVLVIPTEVGPFTMDDRSLAATEGVQYLTSVRPAEKNTDMIWIDVYVSSDTYPGTRLYSVVASDVPTGEDDHDVITMPEHSVVEIHNLIAVPSIWVQGHGWVTNENGTIEQQEDGTVNVTFSDGEFAKDFTYCVPWGERTRCWTK
jgi:hypothetical protein